MIEGSFIKWNKCVICMWVGCFIWLCCYVFGLFDNYCMNNNWFFKKEEKYNWYRYVY